MIQPIGYFKLWRELFTKPIWLNSTPKQKSILITLIAMANYGEKKWEWQGKPFECQPGQFITSLDSIVKCCGDGVAIKNVRTALERFEKLGFLANQSTKTGRLITICNWELYQGNDEQEGKGEGKARAKRGQSEGKARASREECKEVKKVKKDIYISCQHLSMTKDEYDKLVTEYGEIVVQDKIEYANNYAKLKNYKSLYLTLNKWLKADKDKGGVKVGVNSGHNEQGKQAPKYDKSKWLASE